jgi:hypothetical protein
METLSHYRQVITAVLSDLAEATAQDAVEILSLFDSTHDNYLLLAVGWDGVRRIHHIIAHLRIRNDKIWVEADHTDAEFVQQLLDSGVPREAIVLAFYSPQKRALTEFAVA